MSETQFENEKLKKWIQDNLRIILSIAVIVVIAGLIHSYSKRTDVDQLASNDTEEQEEVSEVSDLEKQLAELGIEDESIDEDLPTPEDEPTTETESQDQPKEEIAAEPTEQVSELVVAEPTKESTPEPETVQKETQENITETKQQQHNGQETEGSFIETARSGDGLTHLARYALADYLEKNPDSQLTAEHKIYIEDYLRKNVGNVSGVQVGVSVEFSKSLVQTAIKQSKNLNDSQLNNLKKYSSRVSAI